MSRTDTTVPQCSDTNERYHFQNEPVAGVTANQTTDGIPCGEPTTADREWVVKAAFGSDYAEWERGYQKGYDDAINHAVKSIERIPRERGWTSARLVGAIGTLAATVRSLSPEACK